MLRRIASPASVSLVRRTALVAVVLALILVPFGLVGAGAEAAAEAGVRALAERPVAASGMVIGLLAADIVAPVPSSVVSTLAGAFLGVAGGALASWLGLMLGCGIGYVLGRRAGRAGTRSLLGDADLARLDAGWARWGDGFLVLSRAVPVLAEASVLFAGISAMPPRRFLLLTALANAGLSVVYATVGALAFDGPSFLLAFGVSLALPGLALLVARAASGPTPRRTPGRGA